MTIAFQRTGLLPRLRHAGIRQRISHWVSLLHPLRAVNDRQATVYRWPQLPKRRVVDTNGLVPRLHQHGTPSLLIRSTLNSTRKGGCLSTGSPKRALSAHRAELRFHQAASFVSLVVVKPTARMHMLTWLYPPLTFLSFLQNPTDLPSSDFRCAAVFESCTSLVLSVCVCLDTVDAAAPTPF